MINGLLMHKDTIIGRIEADNLCQIDSTRHLLPIYFQNNGSVAEWVKGRAIDGHRTHSRLLKRVLRLREHDDVSTALRVNAATITDNYWIKLDGQQLDYSDIVFKEDIFSQLTLSGSLKVLESITNVESLKEYRSPELTNIGSYEKCWKLENGLWYMYKKGSKEAVFSEVFVYQLGEKLGFNMAEYQVVDQTTIKSLDFTAAASVDYEPISAIVGENVDYVFNYKKLLELSPKLADEYHKIIFLDSLCFNFDRHTLNYGVLRNSSTGDVLSLAPNFDNNLALISLENTGTKLADYDLLIADYIDFVKATGVSLPVSLSQSEINSYVSEIAAGIPIGVDKERVTDTVCQRYNSIVQHCMQLEGDELEL